MSNGKIYARLTEQGTATPETATCLEHAPNSVTSEEASGPLRDCSGNPELECLTCGMTA